MNKRLDKAVKRPRARDAAATRADLLKAARNLFSKHGYELVGLRQIAAEVGVNQALVIRYFGSKRGLFAAAIEGLFTADRWFEGDRKSAGWRMAAWVCSPHWPPTDGIDPLSLLIQSCGHPEANEVLRAIWDAEITEPLAAWLGGPRAVERAGVLACLIVGSELLRQIVRSRALNGPDLDAVIVSLGNALQQVVDDESPALLAPTPTTQKSKMPNRV